MRIQEEQLRQTYTGFAKKLGANASEAATFATCLLRADVRGQAEGEWIINSRMSLLYNAAAAKEWAKTGSE